MNSFTEPTTINCQTTEEHSHAVPSTSVITSSTPSGEFPHNIQGVSGAVYAPMDTTPQTPEQQANARVARLLDTLTGTLTLLVKELQAPTQPQTDLEEAVSTALEQADWFTEKIHNTVQDSIDDKDFDYEIGNAVERYMRNHFDATDHYDFDAEVRSRVEDEVESIIDGLVEEAVEARITDKVYAYLDEYLESVIKERLQDANITINF